MDVRKKRSSFDDTATASALRRLTRSPTGHRLSLRRAATASSSASTSSSSASVVSFESETHTTCVYRETSGDECALYRFIVWAAIKRNACPTMTDEERRECPLLRCRQRFPTHELMLRHLYSCTHIASGEYWCYDCAKPEQIIDNPKCNRCIGHPSKRKKIMSMAKNLFSSLGHKTTKTGGFDHLDLNTDEAPPSYGDSLLPPRGAELYSTEIHEIDSQEVPLSTIPEVEDEQNEDPTMSAMSDMLSASISPLSYSSDPETVPQTIDAALTNWQQSETFPQPSTVAPVHLLKSSADKAFGRPSLQVHTDGLEQYRAQAKRRSKALVPTSSVRSTASTNSTNSTNSMSSAASYDISPISGWSGGWARQSDFDSAYTSPVDDLVSPGEFLAQHDFSNFCKPNNYGGTSGFTHDVTGSFLSELPADIPMLDVMSASDPLRGTLGLGETSLSYDTSLSNKTSKEPDLSLTDTSNTLSNTRLPNIERTSSHRVSAKSLIGAAQGALQMHIAESMAKLKDVSRNHLVDQLRNLSPNYVALAGLETVATVLDGRQEVSAVNLLCFVHVIYSFSLVIHEQDAPSRWSKLFTQAMSYGSYLSQDERQAYMAVVYALWKPNDMSDGGMMTFLRTNAATSTASNGHKGKEVERAFHGQESEPLVFVAQYFLDELEYSALRDVNRPEVQASELCVQHLKDVNMGAHQNSPFAYAVKYIINDLSRQYSDIAGFSSSMETLLDRVNSSYVSTARRLELELMQAGKRRLSPDTYFDDYILHVRRHVDSLYAQNMSHFNSRLTYYRHGINLMRSVMSESHREQAVLEGDASTEMTAPEKPAATSIEDFMGSMTPNMAVFDFDSIDVFNTDPCVGALGPVADVAVNQPAPDETQWLLTPGESSSSGACSAAPATPSAAATPSSASSKTESNSCCDICGYRPKGDPRWFGGSMAKHKKLQHANSPPKIYRCMYPGCKSQYKNRPDNLRQHQIEKGHFVEGQGEVTRRPSKRKKTETDE